MATSRICSIPDCGKPAKAHGWCVRHYRRWLRHGDPCGGRALRGVNTGTCAIPGCERKFSKRGWCSAHYQRWKRHGDPLAGGPAMPPNGAVQEFLRKLLENDQGEACVPWPFGDSRVHATVWLNGRTRIASRLVCERAHGKPPTPKHHAAHSCGNGHERCVNPNHLRWATAAENIADKFVHGTLARGGRHGMAKLTLPQVLEIVGRLNSGASVRLLADEYNVSRYAVYDIKNGHSWSHETGITPKRQMARHRQNRKPAPFHPAPR